MSLNKIKIGVIGKGKTGSKVIEVLQENPKYGVEIFDSKRIFRAKEAKDLLLSGIICFAPGDVFEQLLPELLELSIPVIIGSTGMNFFPTSLSLSSLKSPWIISQNFSRGILALKFLFSSFHKWQEENNFFLDSSLLDSSLDKAISITEHHHQDKKDAPSGTALMLNSWIQELYKTNSSIESIREGTEKGTHKVLFSFPSESISIEHKALDRKVFAKGAIWALEYLCKNKQSLENRIFSFEECFKK